MKETLIPLYEAQSVNTAQVSRRTGFAVRTVQKYARLGIIPGAFQPAGKRSGWRFKIKPLEEWWAKQGD